MAGDAAVVQSLGSLVPPTMVPPWKLRGMQKDQVPSAYWRVRVRGTSFLTTQVWPFDVSSWVIGLSG